MPWVRPFISCSMLATSWPSRLLPCCASFRGQSACQLNSSGAYMIHIIKQLKPRLIPGKAAKAQLRLCRASRMSLRCTGGPMMDMCRI